MLPELEEPVEVEVEVELVDELVLLEAPEVLVLEVELVLLEPEVLVLDVELVLDEELELLEPPPIVPAEAVSVTRSSLAPSSRRTIRSVCAPAATLLNVAGVIVP